MKNWFLQFKIKNLQKSRENRTNVSYEKAKNIGFIFDSTDAFKKFTSVLKEFENDSKNVHIIVQLKNKKEDKPDFKYFYKKQIGVFGKIQSEELLDFIKKELDFLFYFGKSNSQLIKYALLKSKANCRVGYFNDGNEFFFDLMFDKMTSEINIIEKIKQIRVNE